MSAFASAFRDLLERYEVTDHGVEVLWSEIVSAHSATKRHYHTIQHLEAIHAQLHEAWGQLEEPDAVLLAIAYHDIVYSVSRKDNEERSAELMCERMLHHADVPNKLVERAVSHILATKEHKHHDDPDTNLFTDADLSILGSPPDRYRLYTHQVRREFRRYPDLIYNPARRKVLKHFLAMESIFKTAHFRERLEVRARVNLEAELKAL